jgi:DNA-directed RNA polymerase alpha subunit
VTKSNKTIRICPKGHKYYKSSDCPTCLICEQKCKPQDNFLALLSAPTRRALESEGITTLQQLSKYSKAEILKLHGIGPSSIPKLLNALQAQGLYFKNSAD